MYCPDVKNTNPHLATDGKSNSEQKYRNAYAAMAMNLPFGEPLELHPQ